jgi:hypothetical protein
VSNADQGDDDLHRPSRVAHIAMIAIQRPFMKRTVPEIGPGRKARRLRGLGIGPEQTGGGTSGTQRGALCVKVVD